MKYAATISTDPTRPPTTAAATSAIVLCAPMIDVVTIAPMTNPKMPRTMRKRR